MPLDIAQILLRRSLRAPAPKRAACACCHRTPVPGELIHVLGSDRALCALCVASLPEDQRREARRERVHARDRHVAVAPRAA